ncbi:MAG TPA: CPXCG motif-containing cysteine-rich protein [Longimicrobiales bacterium]|nr:CPXCG motif-containing cysteine-rich protein [Longimicrobiales bacterium]
MSELDDEFPPGDGVADLMARIVCPYCGEAIDLVIDPGGGTVQEYVEDCEVCCRPLQLSVSWGDDGSASVEAVTDDDG